MGNIVSMIVFQSLIRGGRNTLGGGNLLLRLITRCGRRFNSSCYILWIYLHRDILSITFVQFTRIMIVGVEIFWEEIYPKLKVKGGNDKGEGYAKSSNLLPPQMLGF